MITRIRGLVVASAFFMMAAGCEDQKAGPATPSWVAPRNIAGVWQQDTTTYPNLGYCLTLYVTQDGTNATALYNYACTNLPACASITYPATYDLTNGLLVVQFDLACWKDFFRFLSDREMRRVSDPVTPTVHGIPFYKER